MKNRIVYADNAATTKVSPEVMNAMYPLFMNGYGNASSVHSMGRSARRVVEDAREKCAKAIGAEPSEIYFTSGGTESDNWAIRGVCRKLAVKGKKHIITTAIEHHAVLDMCKRMEKQGFEVSYLPVNELGTVSPDAVENAIREDTALVTVMYANNEIGTIQPISEIGEICRKHGVLFHTDAVQAVGNVNIDVKSQNIDLMSVSGHKIHASKGIGLLYIKKGLAIDNFMTGGAQERNRRAGTENVPAIAGFGVAMEIAAREVSAKVARLTPLRDRLIDGILELPHTRLNGCRDRRLAGNCNISIEGIEGESLLLMLDMNGICASSGSACTSGSLDPSHVLLALGLSHEIAHGSLRLTIDTDTTEEDVDYILEKVPAVVNRLREMSPLWEKIKKEKE